MTITAEKNKYIKSVEFNFILAANLNVDERLKYIL